MYKTYLQIRSYSRRVRPAGGGVPRGGVPRCRRRHVPPRRLPLLPHPRAAAARPAPALAPLSPPPLSPHPHTHTHTPHAPPLAGRPARRRERACTYVAAPDARARSCNVIWIDFEMPEPVRLFYRGRRPVVGKVSDGLLLLYIFFKMRYEFL